ncbi:putative MFS family arabinose efflux permease [Actinocorallia herbida]|uniref:Putative MFS family arabinose efflux permease n=1 Tax=Actinocorallia herbida TaxID=58109 RepID=A0A3N1D4Y4_9ACTN|nr:MFS transporter [Actinocorallia herbida]ROO88605.1 putative MFS family arabinose efflux permease [Actinocorallia herbida]
MSAVSDPPRPGTRTVEITAYPGRPPVAVDPDRTAPFGWWPAIVIALVALIDRVEANLVAGALPKIQAEFGFSDTAGGAIATAAAVAGVVLLIPAGRLADRGRRNWTVALVVAVWSLLTIGSGLVQSYATLFAVRVLLGGAGLLYNPSGSSILADYYPGRSRARAYGLERFAYFSGLPLGIMAGGLLSQAIGWRAMFFVIAIPGVLIALACLTVREPVRGLGDRIEAARTVKSAPDPEEGPAGPQEPLLDQLRGLLAIRTLRSVVLGLTVLFFGLGGLYYWMPSYYERTHGLAEGAAAGISGGVGLLGMIIGTLLGARYGDRLHGRSSGWRVHFGAIGVAVGTVGLAGTVLLSDFLAVQTVFYCLSNIGFSIAIPNLTAANADVVPTDRRGLGFAVLQFLITLGGSAGPLLVGAASDLTGSLRGAFAVLLIPLVIGTAITFTGRKHYDGDAAAAVARGGPDLPGKD